MTRFVVIATWRRGKLEVPEPLDEMGQIMAARSMRMEAASEEERERQRRVTMHIQEERDRKLKVREVFGRRQPEREEKIVFKIRNAYGSIGGGY
jgi:cytosine/adenosine deaminase-related metal-dependent hydrolase